MIDLKEKLKNFSELKPVVKKKKKDGTYERIRINSKNQMTASGVYIFWWIGDVKILTTGNTKLFIKGNQIKKDLISYYSNHKCISVISRNNKKFVKYLYEFTLDKKIYNEFKMIPLYIGKTTNLDQRIQQHILNGTKNYGNVTTDDGLVNKKTTSCQLRSHLEYILKKDSNNNVRKPDERFSLALENVNIQYFENNICDFGERFYLEDELIGRLKPWFNVDSER